MDASIVNNIITSSVTVSVGIITAVAAYFGTIKGSKLQIENQQVTTRQQIDSDRQTAMLQIQTEQQRLNDSISKQNEFNQKAIKNFISHEIKTNFMKLHNDHLTTMVEQNSLPFQFSVNYTYDYQEYNNLKYDLIKFESEEVEEIISIYDMFYLIQRKQDIKNFNSFEYDAFKKAFEICLVKYK